MSFNDIRRIISTQSVALASTSQASGAKLSSQTYAIEVGFISAAGVGAFVNVGSNLVQANSTNAGALVAANYPRTYKTNPGQTVAGQCVGSTAVTLYITELGA
ncbi:MAG: hypothetical protein ACM3IH_14105 [Sphingobacteriales bacterium]